MASSRIYAVTMKGLTIVGANTLVFINPSASQGFRILRAWCSQYGTSTAQQLGIQISSQPTGFPTIVSATPAKIGGTADPASGITGNTTGAAGTCGVNASSEGTAGGGTKVVIIPDAFCNLNGWLWVPTPSEQIVAPAGSASGIGLFLISTPTTTSLWNAGMIYEEV